MNAYQSIKHDASGFLVGELIETSKSALASQQAGVGILRGIRADVSAIARAMGVASRASSAQGRPHRIAEPARRAMAASIGLQSYGMQGKVAEPRARDAGGRFLPSAIDKTAIKNIAKNVGVAGATSKTIHENNSRPASIVDSKRAIGDMAEKRKLPIVSISNRDAKGRFGSNGASESSGGEGGSSDKLGKVADALKGLAINADGLDPTITAMGEIKSVLEPLGRGAFALFGRSGDQKKERWYSKILKALTERKGSSSTLISGSGGEGDGAMAGAAAGLVSRFLPLLVSAIGVALAVAVSLFVGTKLGGLIYEWLDKSGIIAKVFDWIDRVKKIPENIKDGEKEVYRPPGSDKPTEPLKPATSIDQSVGRGKGHIKNALQDNLGYKPLDDSNDPLSKGYRGRANLNGIKGGEVMSAMGTYTPAEAKKIRDLKSGSANTGVFGKGGMSAETQAKIEAQAEKYGLDPMMMKKIAAMESGGNPNAISNTGAIGTFQFTGATATGIGIKDRFNEDQNIAGGMRLANKNKAALIGKRLPVTAENLYMMHQLGPPAAYEVIRGAQSGLAKSSLSPATQNAMNLNYGAKSATAQSYIDTNSKAMGDRLAMTTSGIQASTVRTSVTALPMPQMAAVPVSVPQKVTATPEVAIPSTSGADKDRPIVITTKSPIGQNVEDRTIAHTASGGIGATGGW
jgi:Transglycosylase SLT domain